MYYVTQKVVLDTPGGKVFLGVGPRGKRTLKRGDVTDLDANLERLIPREKLAELVASGAIEIRPDA